MALKSKYASLDTSIILRLIVRDSFEQHRLARNLILNGQKYVVDDCAVMEAVYVLTKESYSRSDIVDSLRDLLSNSVFIYNATFFEPIFKRYATHPSLSFNDCVLEARAELADAAPLWTFDRKFAHQSPTARLLAEP